MSKEEEPSQRADNSNSCKYCNKTFSTMEQLTAHYRKEHPESF
ncbi:MAG: C2H2-type zinc finger protein [Nitrososphaeraceae archaeon]